MNKPDKSYESYLDLRRIIPLMAVLFFLTFLILAILVYRTFFVSIFIAGIFYILFLRPYHFLAQKLGQRKTLASILTTLLLILTIVVPVTIIVISLIQEVSTAILLAKKFFKQLNPEYFKQNELFMNIIGLVGYTEKDFHDIQIRLLKMAQETGLALIKDLRFFISDVARIFMNFIISIFLLFFFFRNGDDIGKTIYDNFPFPEEMKSQIIEKMIAVFNAVVKGNIFIALAQGLVIGLLFWIFGLPTPVMYGILGVFFGLIPVIGTNILWFPAAVYLYSQGHVPAAIVFGTTAFSAYLLLENLAKPMMLDKKLNLHPLIILLSLLGGLSEFGLKGLIIGPFSVTIFLTFWQLIKVWNVNHGTIKD